MKINSKFTLARRIIYAARINSRCYQRVRVSTCILFSLLCLPALSNPNQSDYLIIGSPTTTLEKLKEWSVRCGATKTFVRLADIYWKQAIAIGINPVVAYCQAAKETGYGHFGGIVNEENHNLCGLKKDGSVEDNSDDYMKFNSWEEGVSAHLDHLALYAGQVGYPKPKAETKDPRHYRYLKGDAPTVYDLSGKWSISPTYGVELVNMIMRLNNY